MLQALGGIPRQAPERVARLRYARSGRLLACQSAGKLLELFRARSEKEVRKHVQRRKKRKRDKAAEAPEGDQDAVAPGEARTQQDAATASDLLAPMQVSAVLPHLSLSGITGVNPCCQEHRISSSYSSSSHCSRLVSQSYRGSQGDSL